MDQHKTTNMQKKYQQPLEFVEDQHPKKSHYHLNSPPPPQGKSENRLVGILSA